VRDERKMDERLEQALPTLRGIRQRYETGRDAGSGYLRSYTVQVALGYADMLWIATAIEALDKAPASGSASYAADGEARGGAEVRRLRTA
jgi:hypothetical protein